MTSGNSFLVKKKHSMHLAPAVFNHGSIVWTREGGGISLADFPQLLLR